MMGFYVHCLKNSDLNDHDPRNFLEKIKYINSNNLNATYILEKSSLNLRRTLTAYNRIRWLSPIFVTIKSNALFIAGFQANVNSMFFLIKMR